MDEKTVTMMEGVAREWRVRVMDSAGNVLNPEGFSFYGAAADGVQVPRRMQVHAEGDVAVLRLPGLWMSGRCWRYQVLCQDVLTGVEWVLCQGDVVLERRVACNGPALHEDAVLVDVVLDSEMDQVEVYLGDSTAASAEAARLAVAARDGAEAGAARSVDAAAKAEALKGVALDAAAKAALSAEGAEDSKRLAVAAARDAVADAQLAEMAAAEAEASREAAEADAKRAGARAAEAEKARQDAQAFREGLEQAATDADAARQTATQKATEAAENAAQAAADKLAAEQAKTDAQAAQTKAEQEAERAETAQAKATEEAAGVAEVAWARGFPVFDFDLKADKETQLRQLAPAWVLSNVALRCTGLAPDGEPEGVFRTAYSKWGAAAWVNLSVHFIDSGRFRTCGYTATCAPGLRYIWYIDNVGGVTGIAGFAAADYYYKEVGEGQDLGGLSGSCKVIEVNNIKRPHRGSYSHFQLRDNISRIFHNTGEDMNFICKSPDGALRHVRVPDGAWEKCKLAIAAFSGAANLPEEYVPDALPQLVAARSMFNGCNLSAVKSISILNSLQQNTGSTGADDWKITMGMHVDHQADEEVLAAIANAESKGWVLTVQWNGTPTAQASVTYGLRKPPIYARVYEDERPDGTVERHLEWGHYVTDPTGYEEFRSVEAAREYYGLPEEDLTENK